MRSPYDVVPTVSPSPVAPITPTVQPNTNAGWLTIAIIAVLGFLLFRTEFNIPHGNDNDNTVVVDPVNPNDNKKDVAPVSLKDSYVIAVYETTSDKMPVWMVNFFADHAFWHEWIEQQGMFFQKFSPVANAEQAESFIKAAEKRNIKPPFLVHAKKGTVISIVPLDKEISTDEYKTRLQKGK